jgi:GH24 family phage-related lysozyme (muramidase)/flagellum-specific peptidoglycan hydrolase FlgJ
MKFKESSLLKKHKQLLGNKRDKRKKVVKSTSPTPDLKKAVIKKQEGGTLFSIYNSIDPYIPPTIDFNAPELETEIVTNPIKKRQAKVIEEAKKSTANPEVQELKEINSEVPSKKIPKSSETWKSPYSNKNEWVSDLTNAYKKAGITNDNAIRMLISQDALESGWGRSAQGKFNFGNLTTGSSWKGAYVEGKDHDAKGNPIKQRFRAYDSMDEYAADKIQFLKRLYDFDENDDIDKFISKLSGANKGKRRYAEATNYATSLANVYNKFAEGGIIKAQNGSKSEELLVKKALEFGQKTSEKMSPYDVRLIDFIKSKEGFRPKPEKDKTDGKWTVGYGLTDPKLIRKYRNGITEEEASKHLIQHLQMGADSLATMPYYDNLNLGEKTALNDLIYNVGWNKFKNSKRLQSHLRTGNDAGAKKEMNHGEHQARGLKIRRNQNRQMYDSTFSWKYKKGGVAKYQEPAQGIQRRDAVADYRPAIPLSPIKRTYTPTPQPILSQDNRNRWQHEQASKQADRGYNDYMEAKKTQKGLNNLNGFLNFTDVMGLGTGIAALLGKGVKYAGKQAIKRVTRNKMQKELGEDYTNRLIKALGDRKESISKSPIKYTIDNRSFVSYLESLGVDVSQFTNRDIARLRELRASSISQNLPANGRYTLISDISNGNKTLYDADLFSSSKSSPIGTINGEESLNKINIGKVEKLDNTEKRVSEDLYNSIIQYGKQKGHDGLISGEILESPEITYKIWEHFPDKKLMGKTGAHYFNYGKTIRNPDSPSWNINNGNVYKLTKPSRYVPTKHKGIFNPEIIDPKTGKLNPPDWNNPDIYKAAIPLGVGTLNNKEENK